MDRTRNVFHAWCFAAAVPTALFASLASCGSAGSSGSSGDDGGSGSSEASSSTATGRSGRSGSGNTPHGGSGTSGGESGTSSSAVGGSSSAMSETSGSGTSAKGPFALGQVPFTPTSTWNSPIATSASFTLLAWPATGLVYGMNWSSYSAPIYVAAPSDPIVDVACAASWGWPANPSLHVPSGATGAPGTDGEIVVIDGTTVYNFWRFDRTNDTAATASAYAATDVIKGTGWGTASPFLGAGIMAAGSSGLAGMLVEAETDAGEIRHAIQIQIPQPLQNAGHTGDAIGSDGQSTTGLVQEGDHLGIPPSVAMPSGLSPLGEQVFKALQAYGAFDIDTTDCCSVVGRAEQNAYDQATMTALDTDLGKVFPLLQKVN
jgi:hypothetical protein